MMLTPGASLNSDNQEALEPPELNNFLNDENKILAGEENIEGGLHNSKPL